MLAAAERASRVRARFALGSRRRFEPNDVAWVEGIEMPLALATEARRVEVHSLERSDQLFELALADPAVDAALELLEPALEGQTTAAMLARGPRSNRCLRVLATAAMWPPPTGSPASRPARLYAMS